MKYIIFFVFFLGSIGINAQQDTLPIYYVEQEQVVLEFDIREYQEASQKEFAKVLESDDLDINTIINAPDGTSINNWQLHKLDANVYQLRKDLDDFDNAVTWISKYLISGKDWAANPFKEDLQKWEQNNKKAVISEEGNTLFFLAGHRSAKKVILSGSFNHWNYSSMAMTPTEDGWELRLDLPIGIHEYKFIVDGVWMHDPANYRLVENEHGTFNSIVLVGETVLFQFPQHLDAKQVILSGSFNNWDIAKIPMQKSDDGWYTEIPLPPGKHYYKFIVDGKWKVDPMNNLRQVTKEGYINSVLLVH